MNYAHAQDKGLIINEIMQSNVECIMDDIHEFPDSWVELYNAGDADVNLKDYQISNKNKVKKAWQLPDKTIAPGGYVIIYCDKEGKEDNRLHPDFRLESGKGCTLYLFKNKNAEPVDSLPYIDGKPLVKMPAPDVAFGRKTDGADEWGYQLTPSAGKANTGEICDAKHILGAPVFSELGRVTSGKDAITLELSLPAKAPEGAFITYTTNGNEPTATSTKYTQAINITKTTVIRAKVFCDGWLSPLSTAQSYIFHPRKMTVPIFSVQTNDLYLNGGNFMGLFKYNTSKEDKKTHDWRRPVNIEFFPVEGEASAFNQPGETRIQGGQSRSNALKSMVFYANKRFDPDHKRYSYEFFPDQKPGITEFKSFSLRDGGNDFSDMYFRDLIIQRTMGKHVDLDWQAGHTAVLYINGQYMGMLNIRERSNEDNIYSNYDGLEDLDMIEISHEKVNNVDQFIEELKEGSDEFYNAFKTFYSEKGHTKAEYEQWLDVSEYLNVMVLNLFYGNLDFPGNNLVFWRPNDDDKDSGLPKRWRVILKDTDFGLGLYNRSSDVNTIDMIYNPSKYSDNWAFSEVATRLFRNMMENEDLLQMFIDKSCIYMGDFMNAEGTGATMDAILDEALEEFVAHRDKYNSWGNNRQDILNKFENAKKWLAGYEEQGWGGGGWWGGGGGGQTIVHQPRTDYFTNYIGERYKLGTAIPVTINKDATELPDTVIVNDIPLSKGVFNGKLFPNRQITVSGIAPEGKAIKGWKVITSPENGSTQTKEYEGAELSMTMPVCKSLSIEAILGEDTGINAAMAYLWKWQRTEGGVNVSNVPDGQKVSLYDLRGVLKAETISNGSDIFLPAASGQFYILKVGSESVKIK
ncbi:MAG: CotH kinase family protein [Prevotella sp.]|nr:CotH kinase family protein [Prevotella sp.]